MIELANQSDIEWCKAGFPSLPTDWKAMTVDEIKSTDRKSIISGPFGSNISSKYFVEDGVPVVRGNNLSLGLGEKFKDDGFVYITPEKASELNTWAAKNDLIFTAVGTIGQVGLLRGNEKFSKYIISNKQLRLTVNKEIIDPLFVYYWFASEMMVDQIIQRNTGSSVPLINLSVLKSLVVPVPPLEEQKAIASVMSSLDDKIDLLHRQNKTLESMAETLFRQWFIEEAQEDWEEKRLADDADHIKAGVTPAKNPMQIYTHYSLPAFDEGMRPVVELGSAILSNKYGVVPWSILVSKLNPRFPRIWPIGDDPGENAICSTEFQVFKPKNKNLYGYLYYLLKSKDAREELSMAASGTSGSHQRVRPEDILNIGITLPSIALAEKYSELMKPSINKFMANLKQIHSLEKLRDTLLPKLMSGEVRVAT